MAITYQAGTELVTLTIADEDVVMAGAKTVVMPTRNFYPRGGVPKRSRTIARASQWCAYAFGCAPESVAIRTAE